MKIATLIFIICSSLVSSSALASVSFDDTVEVVVETKDGKVAWSKIAEAITKEIGADIPLLGQVPAGELDINAVSTRWVVYGANQILQPALKISINRKNNTVVVRINKTEIQAALDRLKKDLQAEGDGKDPAKQVFGLRPFHEDHELINAEHIVLLIHGFNSATSQMSNLAKRIEKDLQTEDSNVEVACFDYSSHEGIPAAAASLEASLQTLVDQNPDCTISLVTHSMGGVVSRVMIEKEDFAMAQIKRLIMVAPPNHGTELAALPSGNASFDSMLAKIDRSGVRQALQTLVSIANVSVDDLKPDSKCLKELNAGDRNKDVAYSIILGDLGVLSALETNLLKRFAKQFSDTELGKGENDLNSLLETLPPELLSGQGDGVVSVASGKLAGVEDTVVMSFQHSDLLKDNAKRQGKIIRQILRRLKPSEKIDPNK